MRKICNVLFTCGLAAFFMTFSACNEDEIYDFPGESSNRVYMQDKSADYKIIRTPISTISKVDFETSLECTQKASEDIKATIEIDNSMIKAFNEEHGTNYEAMPTSAILMKNATLTIPAGTMGTIDTLSLKLIDDQSVLASLKSVNGYLIPLRIAATAGGDSQVSTNFYTTYLTVTVTEDNVNHDAVESDITGVLVPNQFGWSATTNGSVSSWYDPINTIFDGDNDTYFYIYNYDEDIILDIDMGKIYTFDAFTFSYGNNWEGSEYGVLKKGMTVFISNDATKWEPVGKIISSSKICVFYAPVTAQYIRIVNPLGSMYGGLFNIYEK